MLSFGRILMFKNVVYILCKCFKPSKTKDSSILFQIRNSVCIISYGRYSDEMCLNNETDTPVLLKILTEKASINEIIEVHLKVNISKHMGKVLFNNIDKHITKFERSRTKALKRNKSFITFQKSRSILLKKVKIREDFFE